MLVYIIYNISNDFFCPFAFSRWNDDRHPGIDDMRYRNVPVFGRQMYTVRIAVQHAKGLRPGRGRVSELP